MKIMLPDGKAVLNNNNNSNDKTTEEDEQYQPLADPYSNGLIL
jgi:hypothetical protein